jgi:hypothetical protein
MLFERVAGSTHNLESKASILGAERISKALVTDEAIPKEQRDERARDSYAGHDSKNGVDDGDSLKLGES